MEEESPTKKDEAEKCFERLEILAKPKKNSIMYTFYNFIDKFTPDRVERIKILLQELFAMKPDEAEKYFNEMRARAEAASKRKKMHGMLRAIAIKERNKQRKEKAYQRARKILKKALLYAVQHETPPIVSIRLRCLSDIILEQICDLMDVNKPSRANTDKCSMLLMSIADWIAIEIEQIYFKIRLKNAHELSNIEWAYREMVMNLPEDFGEPKYTSSKIIDQLVQEPLLTDEVPDEDEA